jgi:DNA mismatch repair protein MutS
VLEDINHRIGARALFATHYLELTAVARELPGVTNVHVAALEREGRVVFLYAVQPGPADRAYGIQVARLAGLPPWVADRAETLLTETPSRPGPVAEDPIAVAEDRPAWHAQAQPPEAPAPTPAEQLAAALRELDLDGITPRQALTWLWEQQARVTTRSSGESPRSESAGSPREGGRAPDQ